MFLVRVSFSFYNKTSWSDLIETNTFTKHKHCPFATKFTLNSAPRSFIIVTIIIGGFENYSIMSPTSFPYDRFTYFQLPASCCTSWFQVNDLAVISVIFQFRHRLCQDLSSNQVLGQVHHSFLKVLSKENRYYVICEMLIRSSSFSYYNEAHAKLKIVVVNSFSCKKNLRLKSEKKKEIHFLN